MLQSDGGFVAFDFKATCISLAHLPEQYAPFIMKQTRCSHAPEQRNAERRRTSLKSLHLSTPFENHRVNGIALASSSFRSIVVAVKANKYQSS